MAPFEINNVQKLIWFSVGIMFFCCTTLYLMLKSPNEDDLNPLVHTGTLKISIPKKSYLLDYFLAMVLHRRDNCQFPVSTPHTDIQMLRLYEKIEFDSIGGHFNIYDDVFKDDDVAVEMNPNAFNTNHKLKVFIVPHSHNDPGWKLTFEQYFESITKNILYHMVEKLNPRQRKFIWSEVSFLKEWWDEIEDDAYSKAQFQNLVQSGKIEIVTGGWVMNDEANTQWQNMVLQLIEGHQWIKQHLNITPKNGWTIDPFGLSPTMAYILKQAGLENLVIQRVHYSVKEALALRKQLEFRWRQMWDSHGNTELFTHMMPYFSYDIPHSCGPNPSVCCQFDFARLHGMGAKCRWGVDPEPITDQNVAKKARILLDQYRKKSELYQTNVLLVPLGEDFSYRSIVEWDQQFENYEKLITFFNGRNDMNIEVKFGTLNDYFTALREEKSVLDFPNLSGDFFTYADRHDNYWSGYYTSRPFYKRMDRVLASYLRAAEIVTFYAENNVLTEVQINFTEIQANISESLSKARQTLSLFQHHDSITGTSQHHVVVNTGKKLLKALHYTQRIIQHGVNMLISELHSAPAENITYYDIDDIHSYYNKLPKKIILQFKFANQRIVLLNSLTHIRKEVIKFHVASPFIKVTDLDKKPIKCQVSPTFTANEFTGFYELAFIVSVPPLSLSIYIISKVAEAKSTAVRSKVKIFNFEREVPPIKGFTENINVLPPDGDIVIKNNKISVIFNENGFLKAIKVGLDIHTVILDFVSYGRTLRKEKSGAYLFIPDQNAKPLPRTNNTVKVIEGPIYSSVNFKMPLIDHTVYLYNSGGSDSVGLEMHNLIDIRSAKNFELAMRLSTRINSSDEFFTDLNGYQVLKRKRRKKLPIQGEYYPMPTLAYIEDENLRFTVMTNCPLGVTSLRNGQLEIMQDRKLLQDDHRGLGEGIVDNVPILHIFRVLLEEREINCQINTEPDPAGYPSLHAYATLQSLLNPIYSLIPSTNETIPIKNFSGLKISFGTDLSIPLFRTSVFANSKSDNIGLIIHRQHINACFKKNDFFNFPLSRGSVKICSLIPDNLKVTLYNSSLTFLNVGKKLKLHKNQNICPMELKTYLLEKQ